MNSDLVSVIIPVYNKEEYLADCIKSIEKQEHKNYEIIIIDDGSLDSSLSIANDFANKNPKIHVIHQTNAGVSSARNRGLELAKGKWIMFVDPDDTIVENAISSLLEEADKNTDIISSCCFVCYDGNRIINHFFSGNRVFEDNDEKRDLFIQLMDSQFGQPQHAYTAIGVPWGKLYSFEMLKEKHLLFDVDLRRAQDNVFNMYAFYYAQRIKYVDIPLYEYRYEHMSAFLDKYNPSFYHTFTSIYKARKACIDTLGLINDKRIRNAYISECCHQVVVIFKYSAFHKNREIDYRIRKSEAIDMYYSGIFDNVLRGSDYLNCRSIKYKYLVFLLKRKFFLLFFALSQV